MRQRVCQMQTKLILAKVNLWHNSFKLPAPGIGIMNEQSNEQQVSTAATPILPTIRPPPYSLFFPPSQICNFAYAFTFTLIHRRCWQTHLTRPLNEWVHHQVAAAGSQRERERERERDSDRGRQTEYADNFSLHIIASYHKLSCLAHMKSKYLWYASFYAFPKLLWPD